MASFFIDTDTGQVATLSQLTEAGAVGPNALPTPPWYPIQGTRDATTLWRAQYSASRPRDNGRASSARHALMIFSNDYRLPTIVAEW